MANKENDLTFHTGGGLSDDALQNFLEADEFKKGDSLSSWTIDKVLGRGGMGVVYSAHRTDGAYQQSVAIKCVQTHNPDSELTARFINERQILAKLEHPNIARLLDGGSTDQGQSYLVMELIDGEDIVSYCENNRLSLKARLELFKQVLDAVECAHQHFIIHRDIKPSNIIVNSEGNVKLLDFGIARLLDESYMQEALTQADSTPLTLQYASPEQLQNQEITTASDIYQLGLLLFQMMTGKQPFSEATSPSSMVTAICQKTPKLMSLALLNSESSIKKERQWAQKLKGDLDAIVAVCLRKSPEDRYRHVSILKDDIHAYFSGFPVSARKGNFSYKLKKTLQRNRALSTVSAVFLVLFTGFLSYSFWAIAEQRDKALLESEKSRETVSFLTEILQSADPDVAQGKELTVLEIVDEASRKLESRFENQPMIKSSLLMILGNTYSKLGKEVHAQPLFSQANEIHQQNSSDPNLLVEGLTQLSTSLWKQSLYEDAEKQLALARSLAKEDPFLQGKILTVEADIELDKGNVKQAENLILKALPLLQDSQDQTLHLEALKTLGFAQRTLGLYDKADQTLSQVLSDTRTQYGVTSRQTAEAMTNLANIKTMSGKYPEAQELLTESRSLSSSILGEAHPTIAKIDMSMGILYYYLQDFDNCLKVWNQAKSIYQQVYGNSHPRVLDVNNNLSAVYLSLDRFAEAEKILLESIDINIELNGPDSNTLTRMYYNLINTYKSQNKFNESLHPVERLIDISIKNEADLSQKQLGRNYVISARVYRHLGDLNKALKYLNTTLIHFEQVPDLDPPEHLLLLTELMQVNQELNHTSVSEEFRIKAQKYAQDNELEFDPDPPQLRPAELK